jgi:hypothetical protein
LIPRSILQLNHVSLLSAVVETCGVVPEVEVAQLIADVDDIRVIVVVSKRFSIIVDILIVRESLVILRFLDVAHVLSRHVAPEGSLDLHNNCNDMGVPESVGSILIVRRSLDVVAVYMTISTATT